MKRILIVDFNGTAPTYNYYFVKGLLDEGLDVSILGFENKSFIDIHPEKIRYKGIFSGIKVLDYWLNWVKLFTMAKSYDAIHFQWLPILKFSSIEVYLVEKLKKINQNIFYTVHNFFPHNSTSKKVNKRYIQLYKLVDNLVVHADATTEKINSYIKRKKTIKIEHGYFYAEFRNQIEKKKKYDLAMIGNILPYKGVEDAIEALSYLNNRNIKMLVAGKCSEEYHTALNKLINDKKLGEQVVLKVGFLSVERLIESYAQSSVSIMPYKEIEQSGVLYTSLGLKVPVIGYESGGLAETITNNCNGYLVKKNDVQALANAIEISLRKCDIWVSYIENNGNYDIWRNNAKILKEHYLQ